MSRVLIRRTAAVGLLLASAVALAQQQGGQQPAGQRAGARPQAGQPAQQGQPARGAGQGDVKLETFEQRLSYALGVNVARNLQQDGLNPELPQFARGLRDQLGGGDLLMTDEQISEVFNQVNAELRKKAQAAQEKAMAEFKEAAPKNAAEAKRFLEGNKAEEGVKVTESGLQYQVVTQGEGAKPGATDWVKVNYKGTLPDGSVFDASERHGGPATFQVNGVIAGWTEALEMMPVGSKYKLFVPPALAYGENGFPPAIGPNQVLIFEVELLDIVAPPAGAPGSEGATPPE